MKPATQRVTFRLLDRAVIGAFLFLVLLLLGIEVARAGEIVPSVGWTQTPGGIGGQGSLTGGLALRSGLVPMVKSEIGISYRSEDLGGTGSRMSMWPVTASLWVSPIPTLYAGGGVGMYHSTIQYPPALGLADQTTQKFGWHLGGGFSIPVVPAIASLDLNGRYVFLQKQESLAPPNTFNPDFWSVSAGLAIHI